MTGVRAYFQARPHVLQAPAVREAELDIRFCAQYPRRSWTKPRLDRNSVAASRPGSWERERIE